MVAGGRKHALAGGILNFGLDAARPGQAPAAHGFKQGEQTGHHENQTKGQTVIHDDDSGDEAKTSNNPPGNASPVVDIGTEEPLHAFNLTLVPDRHNHSLGF